MCFVIATYGKNTKARLVVGFTFSFILFNDFVTFFVIMFNNNFVFFQVIFDVVELFYS